MKGGYDITHACVHVVTVLTQGVAIPQTLNPLVHSLLVMGLKIVSPHVIESKVKFKMSPRSLSQIKLKPKSLMSGFFTVN